ncbi:MAG: RIP metalloprotease RseP [Kiritimatiellia bacterium]|jgi:regulator of sigma E protease|nr:RIP metalloprotease RseP [Kiritimatiellia bacterium]
MSILLPILAILLLFSLSIFVHELGHFLVARALGLVADVFSIGMGPALWKRKVGATVWKIGAIPFGGYVALPQMDPNSFLEGTSSGDRLQGAGDKKEEKGERGESTEPRNLPRVAPWKKILVSVAGATGNIIFAFVLATLVWIVGKPSSLQERNAIIGYVETDSRSAAAGLVPGDEILSLDGHPVASWLVLAEGVALAPADTVILSVRSPEGVEREVTIELETSEVGLRMLPGLDGLAPCHVAALMPGSGAEAAGLEPGDQILRYDGQAVYSRAHLSQLVEAVGDRAAEIVFLRAGREQSASVESQYDAKAERRLIGIQFNTLSDLDYGDRTHPTPWAQVKSHAGSIFRFLRALATPTTSGAAAGAVGGPVLILIMLWLMVKSSFILAIWFTGLLNVNLAILNLLPIPILDGGHVVMNLYEWVTRRPPPPRLVNALANVFAVLFITLFVILTFRDSVRHLLPTLRHWLGG